jgi:hypothetical protein
MVLNSTGLGIGTSSPGYKLTVSGGATSLAANQYLRFGAGIFAAGDGSATNYLFSGSTSMAWRNAADSSDLMVLTNSGNLGLGVTPSAWSGFGKTMEFNNAGCYVGNSGATSMQVGANNYFNGSNYIYSTSNVATRYAQSSGQHLWFTAASGTAGDTISFTQAMTLDASGRLGIGTTSPVTTGGSLFEISNSANCLATITCTNDTTSLLDFRTNSVDRLQIQSSSNWGANFLVRSNQAMLFGTNNTERARITSGGDLLVGTTASTIATITQNSLVARVSNGSLLVHHENGNTGSDFAGFGYDSSTIGTISQNSTTTVGYNTSSDYRLKNTIAPMTGALAKVALLKPVTYKWNADGSDGQGFIAHELAEIVPECVNGEKDAVDEDGNPKYQGIDTSFLVATLTAAIQELKAELDSVKAELATLKGK